MIAGQRNGEVSSDMGTHTSSDPGSDTIHVPVGEALLVAHVSGCTLWYHCATLFIIPIMRAEGVDHTRVRVFLSLQSVVS